MKQTEKQKEFLGIIESAEVVYLSTIDAEGYPSTRAMLNLRNKNHFSHLDPLYKAEENPFTVYLTTNATSQKNREITANEKASLYFYEPVSFKTVILKGRIEVVADNDFKQKAWMDGWKDFYPEGPDSNAYSLLRFVPLRINGDTEFSL